MKKIIALALALIMVLSMGVVAMASGEGIEDTGSDEFVYEPTAKFEADFADATIEDATLADIAEDDQLVAPGEKFVVAGYEDYSKRDWKVSYDFTSAKYDFNGASLIDSIAWEKNADASKEEGEPVYDLILKIKENLTSTTAKDIAGLVTLTAKAKNEDGEYDKVHFLVQGTVANEVVYIDGAKKAADADDITDALVKNYVMYAEDGSGYVTFTDGASLVGTVKVENDEKAQVYFDAIDEDTNDAIEAYLGEDYDAIVEMYNFAGTGFKADVDFQYDAWEEDPHFFYAWDGEKMVAIDAKYDDDEDVDNYVFTADAKGIIVVTDVEIVAAADTKNPDTGANDVVGVAAALAVVSLVAAGAVSLKK